MYKTELIKHQGPWRSRQQLELATLDWVHWFNHNRLLTPIGYMLSAVTEKKYLADLTISHALQEEIALTE